MKYRLGFIDERQEILDYLMDDFLALEKLRTAFPERYRLRWRCRSYRPR